MIVGPSYYYIVLLSQVQWKTEELQTRGCKCRRVCGLVRPADDEWDGQVASHFLLQWSMCIPSSGLFQDLTIATMSIQPDEHDTRSLI
jgi:hypothetical protein